MNRRSFLTTAGLVAATTCMSAYGSNDTAIIPPSGQVKPTGAVTLYYEFSINRGYHIKCNIWIFKPNIKIDGWRFNNGK